MTTDMARVLNDRYRLIEVVGEGGMAEVWRAEDVLLGRTVAVKILRRQYAADPDFVARFRSEARAAAALNDPGVVGVYDVGEDAGRHYLVLEYVPGRDLKSIIRSEAPLSPERAVHIGASLARAVAAAHAIGLVHRDIKPQNVLVAPDGRMKVADFGIARAISAIGTTAPGIVLGTVHYLSPEQATGGVATFASDVYALGVVLYEMLTGRVPFEADSPTGVAWRIAHEAPEALAARNPRVPAVLVGIVDRAMARDPAARYADARALAAALDGFARWSEQATMGLQPGHPPPAAPTGALGRARPAPAASLTPAAGPLLDWSGLLLGLVALAAVAGLIPLWMAVALQSDQAAGSVTPPAPESVATVTPAAGQQGLAPGVDVDVGTTVSMPDTVGQSLDDARRLLESQHLGVTTDLTATHSAPTGQVVAQFPAAGVAVPAGTVARLVVSGQTLVTVPPLSGDYTSVAVQLERAGLVPRAVEQWGGSDSPVGAVLGFDPPPGVRVAGGTVVSVLVNSGTWLPLGVDFADHIHLPGVALARDVVKPGEGLDVELRWEAVEPVTGDYVARVLLADAGGQTVAVVDRTPGGDRPTNTWQAGEVFASDHFPLVVPAELAPGRYTLALELANRADPTQRLEVLQSAFARTDGPRVVIRPLTVAAP